MRLIIIALLVIFAIWIIVAGIFSKKRTSRGRVSWLLVFVLLLPAGALSYFEYKWQTDMEMISSNVVAKISGVPGATLECQRLTEAYVDVWASEKTVDVGEASVGLKYNACSLILAYYRAEAPKPAPDLETLKAFHLLAQESTKLAGKTTQEDALVCLGASNIPFVVEGLGGTPNDGVYSYRLFKQEVLEKDSKYTKYGC